MKIEAPVKINLHLAVLDKRPDSFHNIESLFIALNFGDTLYFDIKGDKRDKGDKWDEVELIMEGVFAKKMDIPIEKNIIFKALSLFRDKSGFNEGLKIRVEKRIPPGGGLGGGSSNAASALLALNQLAEYPLERAELLELGAALGSDVPFFIHQIPAAWVTGRGEYIEPLTPPDWHFVLVNPGFASDTGLAYRLLAESRDLGSGIRDPGKGFSSDKLSFLYQSKLTNNNPLIPDPCPLSPFYNDFLPILPENSTYSSIIAKLTDLGAEYANLSGSGSTCFGVFKEFEQAEKASRCLKNEWDFVQACSVKKFC